jgi:hypothetical protein
MQQKLTEYKKFSLKFHSDEMPSEETSFDENANSIYMYHCHCGRKKLFYSELFFITLVSTHISLSECVLVYVGSAPGYHLSLFIEMFPDLHFLFFDGRKTLCKIRPQDASRVQIFSEREGFFQDTTVPLVKSIARKLGRKIIFMSDMRTDNPDDQSVLDDIVSQQRWVIEMDAEFIMLKLRFPYFNKDTNITNMLYDYESIKTKLSIPHETPNPQTHCLYLDGSIYFQPMAPQSTETRLISAKIKYVDPSHTDDSLANSYRMKYYDSRKFDNQMAYFNRFLRSNSYIYKNSKDLKNHIYGYTDSFDSVAQYYIAYQYLKSITKDNEISSDSLHKKTIRFIFDTDMFLLSHDYYKFGLHLFCSLNTLINQRVMLIKKGHFSEFDKDKLFGAINLTIDEELKIVSNYYNNRSEILISANEAQKYIELVNAIVGPYVVVKKDDNQKYYLVLSEQGNVQWNKLLGGSYKFLKRELN